MILQVLWKAVESHLFLQTHRRLATCHASSVVQNMTLLNVLLPTVCEWHYTFCERQSHCIFSYDQQQVSDIAHFVKGSLIASFPMTNSKWVTLHILWKAVSLHLFLWPTGSEWHCTLCERQSHCISSYDQQSVSDIAHFVKGSLIASYPITNSLWVTLHILWKAVSLHLFLWPTGSEWHCTYCERQSHCIFPYDQQRVSDIAHFVKDSLIHLFIWPTGSEWHCTFCESQSHGIFSYDQQLVSDIAHVVKGSVIASFTMINSKWVTLHMLWKAVSLHLFLWPTESEDIALFVKGISLHLFLWPTASEWHCIFYCIFSYVQQHVSDIAYFIASFPMTNSLWVTLHILWKAVSLHLFLWPTACEWHCTFCERQSHCISQLVSDIAYFVKGSLIASFHMNNSEWVTLHIVWMAISLHLFLWPTASKWNCTFCERQSQSHCISSYDQQRVSDIAHFVKGSLIVSFSYDQKRVSDIAYFRQSHCIFSYDQQLVSDITYFVKGNLIAYFPMTNSQWVTLHVLCKAVLLHLFLWPTESEWHCTFSERQSHCIFSYNQQQVSDIAHFVKGSLIAYFPMTNSEWVILHILWKAVSLHLFLWPTACEWHCTFCERQSHCIFSYDQQEVSDIAHFVKGSLIASFPMTNSMWVTLDIFWKAVSSYHQQQVSDIALLRKAVSSYIQQQVSDIAHVVKGSVISSFPMINRKWVTLHILWQAVSLHLFLWETASEWHCTFCERQSWANCIFSYDQQEVSDIAYFVKGSVIASFFMTNSK